MTGHMVYYELPCVGGGNVYFATFKGACEYARDIKRHYSDIYAEVVTHVEIPADAVLGEVYYA